MTRIVKIEGGGRALILLLPEMGMPEIAFFGTNDGEQPGGLECVPTLLTRASRINGMDQHPPSAVLLPCGGMGLFGWPALQGHRHGRDWIAQFGPWHSNSEHCALVLDGRDDVARLSIRIHLSITKGGALTMRSSLTNTGSEAFTLDRMMAGSLLLEADQKSVTTIDGTWGYEFQMRQELLGSALWLKENRRGRTSHDRYPALLFEGSGGTVTGLHLAWSGNHLMAIDRLDDGRRLVHAGELFEPGEKRLAENETYISPALVMMQSRDGLDGITESFHAHVRDEVLGWPGKIMAPRKVLINTWEGNYFSHDVEHLKRQATAAAKLGVERFVLDDGWFGARDDDTSSLGDWLVDRRKYPEGLTPLIDHVKGLGMDFGLWFEPEMINENSDLYRAHPDWVLRIEGRGLLPSRFQHVLDLTRQDVATFLFDRMDDLLSSNAISFIKWDMNRDLTHAGNAGGSTAGGGQTRAVMALMAKIRAKHPSVEIESCSSGGGRADYGVLANTHRVWVSDCTDALERLTIQRGASIFLPPEVMGAHVSASPNHQTGRRHSLAFRALVALPYHFGLELNPLEMEDEEATEIAGYIALHKRLRPLLHGGIPFRHPVADGRHVYGIRSRENDHAVVIIAQAVRPLLEMATPVRVRGLDPALTYTLSIPQPQQARFVRSIPEQTALLDGGTAIPGAVLGQIGFHIPTLFPESALLVEITTVSGGKG